MKNADYEQLLFYFAYKTFITTADDIIEQYGLSRQHHRFLLFICKKPGITISNLLKVLEISKQGSHKTLKALKEKELIYEHCASHDKRVKNLYPTQAGLDLIKRLNQAQVDLIQSTISEKGNNWYEVMESLSQKRQGFKIITQDWGEDE